MNLTDKPAFVAALNELALLKPGAKLTDKAYAAWWNALNDWPLDEFQRACAILRDTVEFMPNPYHFAKLRRTALETGSEMWTRAVEHARKLPVRGGFLQEILSGDPVLDSAARAVGGYRAIANATERDLQFIKQRFEEALAEIRETNINRRALPSAVSEVPLIDAPTRGPKRIGELS